MFESQIATHFVPYDEMSNIAALYMFRQVAIFGAQTCFF